MLSKRQRLASLVWGCFQATCYIGATNQILSSSRIISENVGEISDSQAATRPVAQNQVAVNSVWGQQTLNEGFEILHDEVSMFKKIVEKRVPWSLFHWNKDVRKERQSKNEWDTTFRETLQQLDAICQLLNHSRRYRLFKPTEKRLVLAPSPLDRLYNHMDQNFKRFYTGIEPDQPYQPMGTSYPKSIRKLSTNEERLYAGSAKFLAGTSPEPGKLEGVALDTVVDLVKRGWLKTLNDLLHKIMPIEVAREAFPPDKSYEFEAMEALFVQQSVFRTVELLSASQLIPPKYVQEFLDMKDTKELVEIHAQAVRNVCLTNLSKLSDFLHHYRDSSQWLLLT